MRQKLLVFTSTFPRWPNDTDPPFVYELSRRLCRTFDVTIHTPHYTGAETNEVMSEMNVHRFRYFYESCEKLAGNTGVLPTLKHNKLYIGILPFFLVAQFFSFLWLVKKVQPDIIHAHWIIPQGFVAVLARIMSGTPVVVTAHGGDVFGLQGYWFDRVKQYTLSRVQGITAVSKALIEHLAKFKYSREKQYVLPMGVDSSVFTPEKKDDSIRAKYNIHGPFLLYIGRLTEKKGVACLIHAMCSVLQVVPDAKLLIIGKGELEQELKMQVEEAGCKDQILFLGSIPNTMLPVFYSTADIFIAPSIKAKSGDTEGFGLTVVEAAMSECLVIASDIAGIRDIITDNKTGFLVESGNSQLLAEKIISVVCQKGKLSDVREQARKRCVESFDWEVVANQYAQLLKEVSG